MNELPELFEKIKIFLVDDDDIDATGIQRALRAQDIKNPVIRAHDGLEALDILRNGELRQPYLILLDINMPRMNGIEFMQALRTDHTFKESVIFVLTTSDAASDKHAAYQHQAAGYIVKQNTGEQFQLLINLIDNYRRTVELPCANCLIS